MDQDDEKLVFATAYNLALFVLIGAACWATGTAWPCIMIVATADGIYSRIRRSATENNDAESSGT